MEKEVNKKLDDFLSDDENNENNDKKEKKEKKKVLRTKGDLIERIDRKFVTEDGRQLLREHH